MTALYMQDRTLLAGTRAKQPTPGEQLAHLLGIAATRPLSGEELARGLVLIAQVRERAA